MQVHCTHVIYMYMLININNTVCTIVHVHTGNIKVKPFKIKFNCNNYEACARTLHVYI